MCTGDYSIDGLEHVARIERKSLDDLVSCCGTGRERFERCVQRLLSFPSRLLVVEADWPQIEMGQWRSRVTPNSVRGSLLGWAAQGLPFVLASSREKAASRALTWLQIVHRRAWQSLRALTENMECTE